MLQLENRELRLDLLDPIADASRQGTRYCWGAYLWQVHDARLGPLLSGPEFPAPNPSAFNGQGLPESFRHRTREGRDLTWRGREGLGIGVGILRADDRNEVFLSTPCTWEVVRFPDHLIFHTRQAGAGLAYELTRTITLRGRTVTSHTQLTNTGTDPLRLQWFAHPFWALTAGCAHLQLPPGTQVSPNPGFAIDDRGRFTFARPFVTPEDNQFALLSLPPNRELTLSLAHPQLARVTFATSFAPNECPVWANAHTVSVEPYLNLSLAPGEIRCWHVCHGFEG